MKNTIAQSAKRGSPSPDGQIFISADLLKVAGPNCYAVPIQGDCLIPEIQPNATVLCDPDAELMMGDFVAIYWKDESRGPLVKRLTNTLPARKWWGTSAQDGWILFCESLNPPKKIVIDMRRVKEVHKVFHVFNQGIPDVTNVNQATRKATPRVTKRHRMETQV